MQRKTVILLIFCGLLCTIGAVGGYAHYKLSTPKYMARIVVGPPEQSGVNNNQSLGTLGILRSLTGDSEGSEVHSQFIFQLTSYETAAVLFHDKPFMRALAEKTDMRRQTVDAVQAYLRRSLKLDKPRVGLLEKSSFTTLTLKDPDPAFARRTLREIVRESDRLVRGRRTMELGKRRAEIMSNLETVTMSEYREVLVGLLAQVEREAIVGRVSDTYGFRTIDPLIQSADPVEPRLITSVGIGLLLGLSAALCLILAWFLRITILSPGARA